RRNSIVTWVISTCVSTTAQCARCHNHKFDPIQQEEYYGLQAVFARNDKGNRPYDPDPVVAGHRRRLTERKEMVSKRGAALTASLLDAALQAEVAAWGRCLRRRPVRGRCLLRPSGNRWRAPPSPCSRTAR